MNKPIKKASNKPILKRSNEVEQLNKVDITNVTNEVFKRYLIDLMQTKQLRQCDIYKPLNIPKQFINNKLKGYSIQYVSLNMIYKIAIQFKFNFDLFKYID